MFEVSVDETFSAGHALRGYKGKCENPHGHNYKVRVTLAGPTTRFHWPALRFRSPETNFAHGVIGSMDHRYLNDQAPFDAINPSAENIAKYFYDGTSQQMRGLQNPPRISSITVWETDVTSATYRPN